MLDRTSNAGGVAAISAIGKSLELKSITKRYGPYLAVDDVSFALEQGEFLTLLGPSGSGKTSTLMMVAGFETPSSGTINVDGRDVVALTPRHRNFGVVFQSYALFPHMTALENVEFPLRMRKVPAEQRRRTALEMLERVGLNSMTERRPRELSGGQQQRVALARALVFRPDALLLDEPLGALDKNLRERMQYEIKELQRTLGISILFVTHDQEEAMSMSDRIAVMDHGRIVQIGSPKEVYQRPRTAFVAGFLGETNMLDCTVVEPGPGRAAVKMANGQASHAIALADGPVFQRGQKGLLSVRPEKVSILRSTDTADFVANGIVAEHTFAGRHSRLLVEALGTTFSVITSDTERVRGVDVGSAVNIGWQSEDAQVFEVGKNSAG
jgi:putative spermidine/putrescine transport system ATP-binding protein